MKPLTSCALVDLAIDITWKNRGITHQEHYFAKDLNCWRDIIPGSPIDKLFEKKGASTLAMDIPAGTLVPEYDQSRRLQLPASVLNSHSPHDFEAGRFYPQGLLPGLPGVFKENMTPFRCIRAGDTGITADLNHPMATFPFRLYLSTHNRSIKSEERGGACTDWMEAALTGPGMQVRYNDNPTQFFNAGARDRRDAAPDTLFYETDRMVGHIDAQASANLSEIYSSLISPGAMVLDLMAGFESHLPDCLEFKGVHGLGLNENELKANKHLNTYSIRDLNADPHLSFSDQSFDAVVCALSLEYLVTPVAVFNEVARVLKPGGIFIVSFSNRWFPEKTIHIWENLHDFERMGLVIEYFKQSAGWGTMSTLSRRGYPRPSTDQYYPGLRLSDPIYAVTAIKALNG